MNNFFQKASDAIKRLINPSGMKTYTIKFQKLRVDDGNYLSKLCNNTIYKWFINHFKDDEDVVIQKIVTSNTDFTKSGKCYIKFKATQIGYQKIFSLLADKDILHYLEILSPYKP